MTRPFRTELRTFDRSDLEPEWASADHECLEIELSADATEAELDRWLRHPDERVFLALLERVGDGKHVERWTGIHPLNFAERVVRGAVDRTDDEDLVWTPLLDRLYRAMPWVVRDINGEWRLEDVESPEDRLEGLVPWLEANRSPKSLDAVLSFEFKTIARLVARHAGGLSFDQVETLAGDGHTVSLIRNPQVEGNLLEWLTRSVLRDSGATGSTVTQESLRALAERGEPVSERVFRQAFEIPMQRDRRSAQDRAFSGPSAYDRARERLALLPQVTAEQLDRLANGIRGPAGLGWDDIAKHPNVTVELLEQAYATEGISAQRAVLRTAAEREAFTAPFLDRIAEKGDLDTQLLVAGRFTPAQQDALADEIRGESRYTCLQVLDGIEGPLPTRVAQGFLEHPNREVRVKAIEQLGRLAPKSGRTPSTAR